MLICGVYNIYKVVLQHQRYKNYPLVLFYAFAVITLFCKIYYIKCISQINSSNSAVCRCIYAVFSTIIFFLHVIPNIYICCYWILPIDGDSGSNYTKLPLLNEKHQ